MDGTLLNDQKEITPETVSCIRAAIEEGLLFTLCTGRPAQGVEKYCRLLGLDVPLITYNGAMLVHARTKEILFRQDMEPEDVRTVLDYGKKYQPTMCIWSENRLYTNVLNDQMRIYQKNAGTKAILLEDVNQLPSQGITKILWIDELSQIQKIQAEIDPSDFRHVTFCTSQPTYLEFFNSKVSKATAMEKLGELYGIGTAEMIAVGDSFNDLPMIRYAGLGVAMENAQPQVKEAADYVTASNQEDGVAKLLEKWLNRQAPCL